MAVEYMIVCDRCASVVIASSHSPADARRSGLADGVLSRLGRKDICSYCTRTDA